MSKVFIFLFSLSFILTLAVCVGWVIEPEEIPQIIVNVIFNLFSSTDMPYLNESG